MINVHRYPDEYSALSGAGRALNDLIIRFSGNDILLLASGGSALRVMDSIKSEHLSSRLTIIPLDERFSTDPEVNNFLLLTRTNLASRARQQGVNFLDTSVRAGDAPDTLAHRYEQQLRHWRETHPQGLILATFGIGADGHISGIMPFPEDPERFRQNFVDTERWVIPYDASGKNPYPLRVTTTLAFLRMVSGGVVYVTGQDKAEPLHRTLAPEGTLAETPARFLNGLTLVSLHTDIAE
ncbi:MAG: 6-phosphogluconolactonase [Patescibacteria group bacterium]|nr:6-phosphogluconolactonase [Patescibacteria group bacterium]